MPAEPTAAPAVAMPEAETDGPSVDFIQAISQFLDTDPSDLLLEMGYYHRETEGSSSE